MIRTKVRCLPSLRIFVALSPLLIAIVSVAAAVNMDYPMAQGQNATTTTNQTATNQSATSSPFAMQNQTATNQSAAASLFGNLTQADLQGVKEQLSTARNAIIDGDDETAYDALNEADSELYGKTN